MREALGWTYLVCLLDIVLGFIESLVHRHYRNLSGELEVEMKTREYYPEWDGLSSEMENLYKNDLRKSEKGKRSAPDSHGFIVKEAECGARSQGNKMYGSRTPIVSTVQA